MQAARWGLWPLGWIAGVSLQLQQAHTLAPAWQAAAACAGLVAVTWAWRRAARRFAWLLGVLGCALLGWASTDARAVHRLAQALPPALEGQDVRVTGTVASLPTEGAAGTRFVLEVEQAAWRGAVVALPPALAVGWYHGWDGDGTGPPADLRAGQRWQLEVRLKAPHGTINPHGFDLELWMFEQGLRASASVRTSAANRLLGERSCCLVQRARQSIRAAIERRVPDRTVAGVLAALVVGDQAAIDREDWELFRATGVAHLMSISGLHVTMFAWLAGGMAGWLWRRWPAAMHRVPAPLAARWGGLAAAAGYALLAGWGVPAQRTVWMIAAVVALRTVGWQWPQLLVLLAAGTVVVVADPWAMLQPGFWLSFVAVGMLVSSEAAWQPVLRAEGWRARFAATLRAGLRTQLVASIGLTPLAMVFFQQVSIVGFLANLVAIPLVTLVITPLAMLGVLLPWLWSLGAACVQGLMAALGAMAMAPWAVWTAAAAPAWAAAAGLAGGALLVLPLPWRLRLAGVPLLLPLLLPPPDHPVPGTYDVVAADIGQGTAVLVRTAGHLLLYDAGPVYSLEADAGHRVLLPLLRARGERQVDLLMLSHRDSDHTGGAASVMARLPVRSLASSLEPQHPLLQRGVSHTPCRRGQRWEWDGVRFDVLHPSDGEPTSKANHLSCVLKVTAVDGTTLLLTGDIESPQESALVVRDGAALASDVLVVPHHGSRTSSTAGFIEAVHPRVAVVQAAYRSRYGHPAPDVVQRYEDRGIAVVRSDRCGAWLWRSGTDVGGVCARLAMARYWHHRLQSGPQAEESPWPSTSR
ncbi:MAG: DNA internalization-related competence protein ComEC/Rec2 [Rubrivivax sp.]|nr:DNA internalization-related competence protein ComEC/Rec2 [Rubrivivax sp.]